MVTDQNGLAVFTGAPGSYRANVSAPGKNPQSVGPVTLVDGQTRSDTITLIAQQTQSTWRLTVKDQAGNPVPNATVIFEPA